MNLELITPSTPLFKIIDIKGATTESGTPNKKSTGIYYYFWTPTDTGDYTYEFTGTMGSYSTTFKRKLKVIETTAD